MRLALVIRHVVCEDLGTLAGVLQQRGLMVRYVEAGIDDLGQLNPLAPEVLIVLGGPLGVSQAQDYPFVTDELRVLERRLAAGRPTLGICLGAQLMARALGATVYAGPRKEIGWAPLHLSAAGWRSCLAPLAKRETWRCLAIPVLRLASTLRSEVLDQWTLWSPANIASTCRCV